MALMVEQPHLAWHQHLAVHRLNLDVTFSTVATNIRRAKTITLTSTCHKIITSRRGWELGHIHEMKPCGIAPVLITESCIHVPPTTPIWVGAITSTHIVIVVVAHIFQMN